MKRKTLSLALVTTAMLVSSLFALSFSSRANAGTYYEDASDCENDSGGRSDIESVKWACEEWAGVATVPVCALWIGASNDSVNPIIYTNQTNGDITIRYYRMCWGDDGPLGTGLIWVEDDNGAINDQMNMQGGDWGKPKYRETTLNIDKFISGISSQRVEANGKVYDQYTRTITVGRCSQGITTIDYYKGRCSRMTENITLRIRALTFQAEAKVDTATTNYTSGDGENSKNISCTNIVDGCDVTFAFNMKRIAGNGSSTYTISKASANAGPYTNIAAATNKTFRPSNGNGRQVESYTEKIKAGQTICYKMNFKPYGTSDSTTKTLTVCAYGVGDLNASIDVKASKDGNNFADYPDANPLYVKPTDTIYLHSTYTPTPQYAAYLKPAEVTVDGKGTNNNSSSYVKNRFETLSRETWRNAFTVQLINTDGNNIEATGTNFKNPGETSAYSINDLSYSIGNNNTGQTFTAKALTNANSDTKTAPSRSIIRYVTNTGYTAIIYRNDISDSSVIKVPYNFNNTTEIADASEVLYAGEARTIDYSVTVNAKYNHLVKGEPYATIVKKIEHKVLKCSENDQNGETCKDYSDVSKRENLNNDSDSLNGAPEQLSSSIVAPDDKAGTRICFRSAVKPATSGADDNLDPAGDGQWAISSLKCYTVAKRPSFQVWGGNIYSSGGITASRAAKIDLADKKDEESPPFVFGSWGELGVIAGGEVKGLASGAGYANLSHPGAPSSDFCTVSTLSFANDACQDHTGGINVSLGNDKKLALDKLKEFTNPESGNSELQQHGDFEWYEDGKLSNGIHFVSNYDGDLSVDRNIIYTGTYTSLESMPKVVIYGKNVKIQCAVTRIDALIIAEETVDTCSDADDDVNAQERSTQLTINGAVIANKVDLKRTYGAGVGYASGIPAEIINFDPSLYLWGGNTIPTDPNASLVNTYLHELAPRL